MASYIRFIAAESDGPMSIKVREDIDAVYELWQGNRGAPFAVTRIGNKDRKVFVNPAAVAYLMEE
jgi:hypothetical protein